MRRTPSSTIRRRLLAGTTTSVIALAAALGAAGSATGAPPAQTVFEDQGFVTASAGDGYLKPVSDAGTNVACLTAGTSTSATPIPGCGFTPPDAGGSGALRLTSALNTQVGGVGSTQSVPITKGLDVVFNTYQYGGTAADGISFYLAATDPYAPAVPERIGQAGGALGYAPASAGSTTGNGLARGYLGIGFDVFGNYLNTTVDGTGCAAPAPGANDNNVSVRGPGHLRQGYCVLQSDTALVGTDLRGTTRADSAVPVEVLINPTSTVQTSVSTPSITVDPGTYKVVYTPIGKAPRSLSGPLPRVGAGIPAGIYPSSWVDPVTGYPYKLTYGWAASTGGSTDVHEVNYLKSQTVAGPVPVLELEAAPAATTAARGTTGSLVLSPSVSPDGGTESEPVRATVTFPSGITPTASTSTGWSCGITGQVQTCTHTPSTPIAAGTALPTLTLPYSVPASTTAGTRQITTVLASTDASAVNRGNAVTVSKVVTTLTAEDASAAIGSTVSLSATVAPGHTGTVTFRVGTTTLCSATANASTGVATCTTAALSGPAGDRQLDVTYTGDAEYESSIDQATLTVTEVATTVVAAATPSSVTYGTRHTLAHSGLPSAATGTVTFSVDGTVVCTATLPQPTCADTVTRDAGEYAVTAAYSGDATYAASTTAAAATATVTKAPVAVTAGADPDRVDHRGTTELSVQGIPPAATGIVVFSSGSTELCRVTLPDTACDATVGLGAGDHPVTAAYSGDVNHLSATSTAMTLVVDRASFGPDVEFSPVGAPYGTPVTVTLRGVPDDATGTFTLTDGDGRPICTITLPSRSCTTTTLVPGNGTVSVAYAGDDDYGPLSTTSTTSPRTVPAVTRDTTTTRSSEPRSLRAVWAAVPGAVSYRLQLSTTPDFGSSVTGYGSRDVGDTTAYEIDGLEPGVAYYYRVVALSADGVELATMSYSASTAAAPALASTGADGAQTGLLIGVLALALGMTAVGIRRMRARRG